MSFVEKVDVSEIEITNDPNSVHHALQGVQSITRWSNECRDVGPAKRSTCS